MNLILMPNQEKALDDRSLGEEQQQIHEPDPSLAPAGSGHLCGPDRGGPAAQPGLQPSAEKAEKLVLNLIALPCHLRCATFLPSAGQLHEANYYKNK